LSRRGKAHAQSCYQKINMSHDELENTTSGSGP
jgi:hypothetical protein